MSFILQQVYNGLVIGFSYSLIAIGLTMIFGLMKVLHIAHGEFYMLGAVIGLYAVVDLNLGLLPGLIFAIVVVAFIGYLTEKFIIKKLYDENIGATAIVTLGLSLAIANFVFIIFGAIPRSIPSPFKTGALSLGPIFTSPMRLLVVAAVIVIIIITQLFFKKTKYGLAMEATFQDEEMASMAGIATEKIRTFTFVYGSILAAIAGVLFGIMNVVEPYMGKGVMLKSWVVILLGGLGSVIGSVFGGLILGVAETLTSAYISAAYKDAIGFAIVIIILVFKPTGLMGKK